MASRSRLVAASLLPAAAELCGDEGAAERNRRTKAPPGGGQVEVTGSAELSAGPDRAAVSVSVRNSKESARECSSSVTRRLDYILQTLRQHALQEEQISVMKHLQRDGDLYHGEAEVNVVFSDFETMQAVRAVLIEKLDKSVCVGDPRFFHSSECLSLLRRRVCAAAVETARLKALDVCNMLGLALGRPLMVREEESREWRPEQESVILNLQQLQKPGQLSVSASSQVFVAFELRPKDNIRRNI